MKSVIEKKLVEKFSPEFLEVRNKSHLHAGHLANETGDTHFEILIAAKELGGSRIDAHRKINALLKEEFKKGLHAVEIRITKPSST